MARSASGDARKGGLCDTDNANRHEDRRKDKDQPVEDEPEAIGKAQDFRQKTTRKAPITGPAIVPEPPRITARMASSDCATPKISG